MEEIEKGSPVKTLHLSKAVFGRVQEIIQKRGHQTRIAVVFGRTQPGANLQRLRANVENLELVAETDLAEEDRRLTEGWGWPHGAQAAHYFFDGRSLCAVWGWLPDEPLEAIGETSCDDCTSCTILLNYRLRDQQTRALEVPDIKEAERLEGLIRIYSPHVPPSLGKRSRSVKRDSE